MERNPKVARWLEFLPTFKNPWAHAKRQRAESPSLVAAQILTSQNLVAFQRPRGCSTTKSNSTEPRAAKTLMSPRRCQKSTWERSLWSNLGSLSNILPCNVHRSRTNARPEEDYSVLGFGWALMMVDVVNHEAYCGRERSVGSCLGCRFSALRNPTRPI